MHLVVNSVASALLADKRRYFTNNFEMRFIIWERSVQKKTDFWIVLCCILKEPKINMLEFSCWCKKIPNLSMKNYTQFHSFSLIKRVKYEMISPFSRNEKWKIFSLHSFREVKVKIKLLKIEIEKWKWKSNDWKSRSRSEFSKKFSRILENRHSRWSLCCTYVRVANLCSTCVFINEKSVRERQYMGQQISHH